MKRYIKGVDRGQSMLFPESLDDWIDEDNSLIIWLFYFAFYNTFLNRHRTFKRTHDTAKLYQCSVTQ